MRKPYRRRSAELHGRARRQQPHEHVAAVERRNRQHVEHGEHDVEPDDDAEHPRSRQAGRPCGGAIVRPEGCLDECEADARDDGEEQIARRTGGGNQHEVAARIRQVPHVHGHRLRPPDHGHVRQQRNQWKQRSCRWDRRGRAGFSDTRPSRRAVGSPSRSAVQACAASCTVSDTSSTMNAMRYVGEINRRQDSPA